MDLSFEAFTGSRYRHLTFIQYTDFLTNWRVFTFSSKNIMHGVWWRTEMTSCSLDGQISYPHFYCIQAGSALYQAVIMHSGGLTSTLFFSSKRHCCPQPHQWRQLQLIGLLGPSRERTLALKQDNCCCRPVCGTLPSDMHHGFRILHSQDTEVRWPSHITNKINSNNFTIIYSVRFVTIYSFNVPNKCIYNTYNIIAPLLHVLAWQFHPQRVKTEIK